MQPHQRFTKYHTFDLTQSYLHMLDSPRRIVALVPKKWEKVGEKQFNLSGGEMQGYLVTEWEEVLIKNLEEAS